MSNCASVALRGIPRDCASSVGGINRVAIANYSDVVTVATSSLGSGSADTAVEITQIELKPEAKWNFYHFRKGSSSLVETLNVDQATGLNYVSSELVMTFARMESQKRAEISALALNEIVVVVEDSNKQYHYLGYSEPVAASAGTGQTGQAKGDANNYSITLQDDSETFPYLLSPECAGTVFATDN